MKEDEGKIYTGSRLGGKGGKKKREKSRNKWG